jgi:adenosylhomocysteine nucleosidase
MPRNVLIVTALPCEAKPLIDVWQAKPLREHPCAERFQVFHARGVYIATTGIGKVRAAIATSALLTGLFPSIFSGEAAPLVVNIGIAGSSDATIPLGTLAYCNKIRDVATNTRLYPDILLRHPLRETSLDTYDHPVTTPTNEPVVVDMEGSGVAQAALALGSPSTLCILKVISDHCTGVRITPEQATALIAKNTDTMYELVESLRDTLPEPARLTSEDKALLETTAHHATLSLSQRIELLRRVSALHARGVAWNSPVTEFLSLPISTKEARNNAYQRLLQQLSEATQL